MVIFCEECGKKYKIDEAMIVGEKARCKCLSCGNLIEVTRPRAREGFAPHDAPRSIPVERDETATEEGDTETVSPSSQERAVEQEAAPAASGKTANRKRGLSIGALLLINFLGFAVILGSVLTFVYLKYVPALLLEQVDLRTASISKALSTAVSEPLLLRNYLRTNKIAETISGLPGVAYVSILNKKGIVVAGIFGDGQRFSPGFGARIKQEGFPRELAGLNPLRPGAKESAKDLVVGGRKIHDVAVPIGETGGVAHVGLFTEDVQKAVDRSLKPLLAILLAIIVLGGASFVLLARTISTPIKALSDAAQRISLGELDHPINVKMGGEIGELATSLERMRFSIKSAIERLRRR